MFKRRAHRRQVLAALVCLRWDSANAKGKQDVEISQGQLWSVEAPLPSPMKVVIGRLSVWNGMDTVHISVLDVPVPAGLPNTGQLIRIDHAPFTKTALVPSLGSLLGVDVPVSAHFESGYIQWQKEKGGVYTIGVREAVDSMFETLRQRLR